MVTEINQSLYRFSFLITTGTYIGSREDNQKRNINRLRLALITTQTMLVIAIVIFTCLYLSYDSSEELVYMNNVRTADRYFCAVLYFIIMVTLVVVDIMLLRRLKVFYPKFYAKEKGKVNTLFILVCRY